MHRGQTQESLSKYLLFYIVRAPGFYVLKMRSHVAFMVYLLIHLGSIRS
jgi:hypothetical protein